VAALINEYDGDDDVDDAWFIGDVIQSKI